RATTASGATSSTPSATADATSEADRLPLNESGQTTTRSGSTRPIVGGRTGQAARISDTGTCSRPRASATPALVTWPAWALRPRASAASSCSALRHPFVASPATYGSVTLVSALVDVAGTAPGMLATQ